MEQLIVGQKVMYLNLPAGKCENGIIKSLTEDGKAAFVVYNCNDDWENYENYTGVRTDLNDLCPGWPTVVECDWDVDEFDREQEMAGEDYPEDYYEEPQGIQEQYDSGDDY